MQEGPEFLPGGERDAVPTPAKSKRQTDVGVNVTSAAESDHDGVERLQ